MQAHLDAAVSVIASGDRQARNAVITVAKELYTQAVILCREFVETGEEVVQDLHQLLSAALTRQSFKQIIVNRHQTYIIQFYTSYVIYVLYIVN